jgi:hypothetical protein
LVESFSSRVPLTLFARDENLGCARGMKEALDWFFSHEEQGIVLEDDCLPHEQFFEFCAFLLEQYRDDPDIWMITGNNLLTEYGRRYGDYFFADGGVWGWASWRDRWVRSSLNPALDRTAVKNARRALGWREWRRVEPRLKAAVSGDLDTWDYQWLFARVTNGGLAVVPSGNLVSNIGFGPDATHTRNEARTAALPLVPVSLPPSSNAPRMIDRQYLRRRARMEAPTLRDRWNARVHSR